MQSQLHIVSIGLVAEPKNITSKKIKIYPVEMFPSFSGELTAIDSRITSSGIDNHNDPYTINVEVSNYIEADWLSMSTNRMTPPDVQIGEQVLLWQYSDNTEYYWTSMGRDDAKRRLETITFALTDIPDAESDEPLTTDNIYVLEASTHGKHITLKTCKRNEEQYAYTIQVNALNSCILIKDDVGNSVTLDSINSSIELVNHYRSRLVLDAKDILIESPNDLTANIANDLTISVGGNISINTDGDYKLSINGNSNIICDNDYNISCNGSYELSISGEGSINCEGDYSLSSGGAMTVSAGSQYSFSASTVARFNSGVSMSLSSPSLSISGMGRSGNGICEFISNVSFIGTSKFVGTSEFTDTTVFQELATFNSGAQFNADVKGTKFYGNFYGTLFGNTVPPK